MPTHVTLRYITLPSGFNNNVPDDKIKKEVNKKETVERSLKFIFRHIGQKLITNYHSYKANPQLILIDLYRSYQTIKYKVLNFIDPPPGQKRGASTRDYFNRIDPKYGLRHYTLLMSRRFLIDLESTNADIDKLKLTEKEKNEIKDFFKMTATLDRNVEENYSRYRTRSKYL